MYILCKVECTFSKYFLENSEIWYEKKVHDIPDTNWTLTDINLMTVHDVTKNTSEERV